MPTKRLSTLLTSAVAGGTLLLAACGQTGPGSAAGAPVSTTVTTMPTSSVLTTPSTTQPSAPATTKAPTKAPTKTPASENAVQPVDCGPVKLPTGTTHDLIADVSADGRVGCTEAFNVFDEFVKLPADKRAEASLGNVALSNGWSCTMDDGETTSVGCVKGKVQGEHGLSLHTRPIPG